jgi:hypothetical protein
VCASSAANGAALALNAYTSEHSPLGPLDAEEEEMEKKMVLHLLGDKGSQALVFGTLNHRHHTRFPLLSSQGEGANSPAAPAAPMTAPAAALIPPTAPML